MSPRLEVLLFALGAAVLSLVLFLYFGSGSSDSGPVPPFQSAAVVDEAGVRPDPEAPLDAPEEARSFRVPDSQLRQGQPPRRLIIESIGVDAPVGVFGVDEDGVPGVPLTGGGVAWYDFSAAPGTGSNGVFAAHVRWAHQPAVFADLADLEVGDTIRIVTGDGTQFVYSVSDNFVVDPKDPASLQVVAPTPTDTITLITCGGSWVDDPDELFGGSFTERVIVKATRGRMPAPLFGGL